MNHRYIRLSILCLLIISIGFAFYYRQSFSLTEIERGLSNLGALAPLAFIMIYSLFTILFLPGSLMTMLGGFLFGAIWGTFYSLLGATLGATLALFIGRFIASEWVKNKLQGKGKQLLDGVETEGWRFVALVRLVPLFPFNLVNYAFGLTRINILQYILATFLFMIPGAFAYSYLGYLGQEAVSGGQNLVNKALYALALCAVVLLLPGFIKKIRSHSPKFLSVDELKHWLESDKQFQLIDVRDPEAFQQSHIKEAFNVPLENIQVHFKQTNERPDRPIAFICNTDRRSAQAAEQLIKQSHAETYIVRGGMKQWEKNQYPTVNMTHIKHPLDNG